jgi:hypothetical protein
MVWQGSFVQEIVVMTVSFSPSAISEAWRKEPRLGRRSAQPDKDTMISTSEISAEHVSSMTTSMPSVA